MRNVTLLHRRARTGASFTEVIMYTAIFVLFMGMAAGVFFWSRKSLGSIQRLEDFQDLRNSSIHIAEQLSYGVRVLSPPVDGKNHHQLLFRNDRNEIVVLFLDEKSRLTMINLERFRQGKPYGKRILAQRAIEFTVQRPDAHLVKYHVRIVDPKGVEFVLANAVKMRNTDINEPW